MKTSAVFVMKTARVMSIVIDCKNAGTMNEVNKFGHFAASKLYYRLSRIQTSHI